MGLHECNITLSWYSGGLDVRCSWYFGHQTITDSELYNQYGIQLVGTDVHNEESHIKLPVGDHKQLDLDRLFLFLLVILSFSLLKLSAYMYHPFHLTHYFLAWPRYIYVLSKIWRDFFRWKPYRYKGKM